MSSVLAFVALAKLMQPQLLECHYVDDNSDKSFSRRFSSRRGMSADEVERRRIYTQILEYEHDVVSNRNLRNFVPVCCSI